MAVTARTIAAGQHARASAIRAVSTGSKATRIAPPRIAARRDDSPNKNATRSGCHPP
jgi:hypothetical protein